MTDRERQYLESEIRRMEIRIYGDSINNFMGLRKQLEMSETYIARLKQQLAEANQISMALG